MNEVTFLQNFKSVANAPNGVQRLRELVLQLAATGRLVPRVAGEGDSESLIIAICDTRERLANERGIRLASPLSDVDSGSQSVSVPDHWRWIRLGNLTSKIGSGSTPRGGSKVYVNDGVPFLRSQNIWNDGVRLDDVVFISAETHEKMRSTQVHSNDILLNITGASLGRCAIVPTDFPVANVSQHVTIIRPLLPETRYFLHICLLSPFGQSMIWGRQVGMAREGLSKKVLEQFEIPLPPLEEQKRIVAKVDELMRLCDRLEAQQQEREKLLPLLSRANHNRFVTEPTETNLRTVFCDSGSVSTEDLRETILSMAIEGKLLPQNDVEGTAWDNIIAARHAAGLATARKENRSPSDLKFQIPSSWAWVSVGDVASTRLGKMLDKQKNRGDMQPYLRNTNVHWFRFELESIKMMPFANSELEEYRLSPNDVLICEGGHGIARSAVWNNQLPDMMFQKALHRVRPLQCLNGHYLTYCLWVYERRGILKQFYTGAGIPHFTGKSLAKVSFPIPPYKEQCRIVAKVNELIARVEQLAIKRSQLTTIAASFAKAAVVAITSTEFKENEIMKPPKTEVVTSLKVGSRPKKSDMAPLATILSAQKAEASAKALWQLSGLEIDVFYRQLKAEIANGWIEEDKSKRQVKEVEVG